MKEKFTISQLKERHSVRSFIDSPVPQPLRDKIKSMVTMIDTHEAGMHFEVFFDDNEPFKGFTRSYGFFRNPRNYIAAVVDVSFPGAYERAGYFAEQLVLNMVQLGIGTCYVGGTFDRNHTGVNLRVDRKILFLILFGIEDKETRRPVQKLMMKMMKRGNIAASQFFVGSEEELSKALEAVPQLPECLEALDCAPSSLNKRPARLRFSDNRIEVYIPDRKDDKQLIDLGIAKFNVQAVLPEENNDIIESIPGLL